jgi:hypothetical protein
MDKEKIITKIKKMRCEIKKVMPETIQIQENTTDTIPFMLYMHYHELRAILKELENE